MVTKISEIGWGIEAGENRAPLFGEIYEENGIKAGSEVVIDSNKRIWKANTATGAAGILGKHYDVDLDTVIPSGYRGQIVTRGYVNMFCDDPQADQEIGTPVFDEPTNAGIAPWAAGGREFGTIDARVLNGDEVCKVWIDRG